MTMLGVLEAVIIVAFLYVMAAKPGAQLEQDGGVKPGRRKIYSSPLDGTTASSA